MFKSIKQLGFVMAIVNRLRLVVRLLRDSRVPTHLKIIPFLSFVSFVLPVDMIPLLGQLDELGIFMLAVEVFIRLSPQDVVYEHQMDIESGGRNRAQAQARAGAEEDVVEGEWRTVNHS